MEKTDKNKKIKSRLGFIFIVAIIIIALLIPFVFAVPSNKPNTTNEFFSVDSLSKTAGSILEMKVNLGAVDYEKYKFTLTNKTSNIANVDTSEVDANTDVEKENNSIVITGNKEEMKVNEITLYYKIPQNAKVGETFTFIATIEENVMEQTNENSDGENNVNKSEKESTENTNSESEDIEDSTTENNKENNNEEKSNSSKQTIEVTITIVEESSENNNPANNENVNNQNSTNKTDFDNQSNNAQNQSGLMQTNGKNNMTNIQSNTSSTRTVGSSSLQSETVTYNGSSNNYLKTLSVDGHEFTTTFSKENTTYFINLEEETTSLDITAKAEDDDATVCIYGNEDIEDGSKILVSVTAENGNVRTYRIYVTK